MTLAADRFAMLRFRKAPATDRYWNKPLVDLGGPVPLTAELAVLRAEIQPGEAGAWIHAGVRPKTGTVDLRRKPAGGFEAVKTDLPTFVADHLADLFIATGLKKGGPDVVIWSIASEQVRFAEVKWKGHDSPSAEQLKYLDAARERGIACRIVEWEFAD